MRRVTDPEILKQLNDNSGQKVTDPDILSELNRSNNNTSISPDLSMFSPLMGMSPTGAPLPRSQSERNVSAIVGSTLIPQASAAKFIPTASNFIKYLSNIGGHAAQTGALGAGINALQGDNIEKGATEGALIGGGLTAASPLIGKAYGAGKNVINAIRDIYKNASQKPLDLPSSIPILPKLSLPESPPLVNQAEHIPEAPKAANELLEKLGQGSLNKEQSATKAASMLHGKHSERSEESGQFFKHVFDRTNAAKSKLYEHVDPLITTALDKYMSMINKLKGLNVGSLYENFKKNPSIENGHWLKSELGTVVGDLKANTNKTPQDLAAIKEINNVRNNLESDIHDALSRHDRNSNENLLPMYKKGVELHKEHVEPFRSTPELREITVKGVMTPKNFENIFNTPSNIRNREGKEQIGNINKIISDLPSEFKDLILYNKIGASQHVGSHEKLLNALQSARNEGYSSFFNPHVEESIKNILQKSKNDIAKKEALEIANKNALKLRDESYKRHISEVKSEHKRKIDQIKMEHKLEKQRINQKNALIREAKKNRNWLTGTALTAGGLGLAGGLHKGYAKLTGE